MDKLLRLIMSPFTFVTNTVGSAFSAGVGGISEALGGIAGGGATAVGLTAIGTIFAPTIKSTLEVMGKPEWWPKIAPMLDLSHGFMPLMLSNAGIGAAIGGVYMGGKSLLSGAFSGWEGVGQGPLEQQVSTLGQKAGGLVTTVGAAYVGAELYKYFTGKSVSDSVHDMFADNSAKSKEALAFATKGLPEMPKLEHADVAKVDRPNVAANAETKGPAVAPKA